MQSTNAAAAAATTASTKCSTKCSTGYLGPQPSTLAKGLLRLPYEVAEAILRRVVDGLDGLSLRGLELELSVAAVSPELQAIPAEELTRFFSRLPVSGAASSDWAWEELFRPRLFKFLSGLCVVDEAVPVEQCIALQNRNAKILRWAFAHYRKYLQWAELAIYEDGNSEWEHNYHYITGAEWERLVGAFAQALAVEPDEIVAETMYVWLMEAYRKGLKWTWQPRVHPARKQFLTALRCQSNLARARAMESDMYRWLLHVQQDGVSAAFMEALIRLSVKYRVLPCTSRWLAWSARAERPLSSPEKECLQRVEPFIRASDAIYQRCAKRSR